MWSPRRSAVKVAGKETIGVGLSGAAKLGDRFWGQNGPFERARGQEIAGFAPRPERVDELEHVVGELTGAVGGGQASDQLPPAASPSTSTYSSRLSVK